MLWARSRLQPMRASFASRHSSSLDYGPHHTAVPQDDVDDLPMQSAPPTAAAAAAVPSAEWNPLSRQPFGQPSVPVQPARRALAPAPPIPTVPTMPTVPTPAASVPSLGSLTTFRTETGGFSGVIIPIMDSAPPAAARGAGPTMVPLGAMKPVPPPRHVQQRHSPHAVPEWSAAAAAPIPQLSQIKQDIDNHMKRQNSDARVASKTAKFHEERIASQRSLLMPWVPSMKEAVMD